MIHLPGGAIREGTEKHIINACIVIVPNGKAGHARREPSELGSRLTLVIGVVVHRPDPFRKVQVNIVTQQQQRIRAAQLDRLPHALVRGEKFGATTKRNAHRGFRSGLGKGLEFPSVRTDRGCVADAHVVTIHRGGLQSLHVRHAREVVRGMRASASHGIRTCKIAPRTDSHFKYRLVPAAHPEPCTPGGDVSEQGTVQQAGLRRGGSPPNRRALHPPHQRTAVHHQPLRRQPELEGLCQQPVRLLHPALRSPGQRQHQQRLHVGGIGRQPLLAQGGRLVRLAFEQQEVLGLADTRGSLVKKPPIPRILTAEIR